MSKFRVLIGLGMILLVAAPDGRSRPVASLEERPPGGFVDVGCAPDPDLALERLVAEERFVEALALAVSRVNERLAAAGPDDLSTLRAVRRAGVVAYRGTDESFAAFIFDTILPALRRGGPAARPELVETLVRRGYIARYQGERALAAALYDEAGKALRGGPRDARLQGFLDKAIADWTRGVDRTRAIRLYEQALRLRRDSPDVPWISIAESEWMIAWTLVREDRWDEARPHVEEARRILQAIGITEHTLHATLDALTAEDLEVHGRRSEAVAAYASAAEQAERARRRQAPGVPRAVLAAEGKVLAVEAIRQGLGERAWELREKALGTVHAELAWLGRAPTVDPAAAERMRGLARRLLDATRDCERAPTVRSIARVLDARVRFDESRSAFIDAHPLPEPSLARVRELLDDRSAMIGWLETTVGDPRTSSAHWGFVLRRDRPIRWVHLGDTRGDAEWRSWERSGLGVKRIARAAAWPEGIVADHELETGLVDRGRKYFEPLRPYLDGVDRLVVEGDTQIIPEAFVGADGRYLVDRFEVVHMPTAATLEILSEGATAAPHATASILAVAAGPPVPVGRSLDEMLPGAEASTSRRGIRSSFARDRVAIADLPALPFAHAETASVAELFPTALRLEDTSGNDVRLASLAASGELGRFDVIHLAGHSLLDSSPERGAIVVGKDGLLSVADVALSWRLGAKLVTLSACQSNVSGGLARGEPLGFTPASLGAGASNVLSSVWPVDDRATAILMRRFYESLTGRYDGERRGRHGPMPAAAALADAKTFVRELRDPSGRRPFEHPAYWAGWVLLGTGD